MTGTEVLEGRVRDENGAAIAADLTARGVRVAGTVVVDDALESITGAVRDALSAGVELVVVTGGLGPTHDDRTMEAVAAACSVPLQEDPGALVLIRDAMSGVRVRASDATRDVAARKQALMPAGAISLPPPGTAPGAVLDNPGGVVVVLPGPPWECMASWHSAVETVPIRALLGSGGGAAPITLRLAGIVESEFIEALDDLRWHDDSVEVGVCAKPGELEVVIRPDNVGARALEAHLDDRFPGAIFSRDGSGVEEVLGRALSARVETLVTAESCTGGIIGARITSVPGASAWYSGGVVSYDNAVKQRALGVPVEVLAAHGAVSAECAAAMAEGVRARLGATWGLSVTGIAGPGGGTPQKPVGLVYVGIAGPAGTETRELHLQGDRERVRQRAATRALHLLREAITG
ncbi:MAG: nicotinamide-nucleotide amidohydrolase family protein [Miltoncostaeaceae bacterium]